MSKNTTVPKRFTTGRGRSGYVETDNQVPLVSMVVAFHSGASEDPPGKDGIARLVCRMLRRGTKTRNAHQVEDAIDRLGAELSIDVAASNVTVHAQVIRRNLKPFVALLGEILGSPRFDLNEFDKLKREASAELVELRDSDKGLAQVAFRRAMFGDHPFGRGAIGRLSTIARIELTDIDGFYSKYFTSGNVSYGFCGDIEEGEAIKVAGELEAALRPGDSIESNVGQPASESGRRLIFVDKPERTQTQIVIGRLGTSPHDADHIPLVLATAVFGGTFTSRLMREIRSKRGWSYGTSARLAIERARHAFTMGAFPAANDAAPCLALMVQLLEKLTADGITPRELSFIQKYMVRSHAFDVDTAQKRLHQSLEVDLLGLPASYHSSFVEHVKAATLIQANDALKMRLSPSDLVIVVVGTKGQIFDKISKSVPNLKSAEVVPFDRD